MSNEAKNEAKRVRIDVGQRTGPIKAALTALGSGADDTNLLKDILVLGINFYLRGYRNYEATDGTIHIARICDDLEHLAARVAPETSAGDPPQPQRAATAIRLTRAEPRVRRRAHEVAIVPHPGMGQDDGGDGNDVASDVLPGARTDDRGTLISRGAVDDEPFEDFGAADERGASLLADLALQF